MGITDCDHVCARCGEHMTSCSLCFDMPSAVVPLRRKDTYEQRREDAAQDRAMRREADIRQGWRP